MTLRGVGRDYAGGVTALRGVDLDIDRGELVAIVGPSGSGKTTMLNVMGTLDRPSTGQVDIDGFDVAELSDRELSALRAWRIGFVFQHFHLAPGVSVLDNVADQALAVTGRTVTVTVPGRGTVKGTISQGGTVITTQDATPDAGTASAGASSTASDERIEVTVTIANQRALGSLQAAPVDVDLASSKREDVLAVPVVALLALAKGGFAVQVVDGATTRIVPVTTGMFAAGEVEISGKGIAAGMRVGVPK